MLLAGTRTAAFEKAVPTCSSQIMCGSEFGCGDHSTPMKLRILWVNVRKDLRKLSPSKPETPSWPNDGQVAFAQPPGDDDLPQVLPCLEAELYKRQWLRAAVADGWRALLRVLNLVRLY